MKPMLRSRTGVFVLGLSLLVGCGGGGGSDAATDGGSDIVTNDVRDVQNPPSDGGDVPMDRATPMDVPSSLACGQGMGWPCNVVTNAGCMTGQVCVIADPGDGGVTSQCVMARRSAGFGDPCTRADDCREGMVCGGDNTCVLTCCTSGDNEPCRDTARGGRPGAVCTGRFAGTDFNACELPNNCDYHVQDCAGGGNCTPIDMAGTTRCDTAGTATEGMPCGGTTGMRCAQGHFCAAPAMSMDFRCRRICDPTARMGTDASGAYRLCPMGSNCGGFGNLPDDFGVCIPM